VNNENIIISESNRPYWQLVVAALIFTLTLAYIIVVIQTTDYTNQEARILSSNIKTVALLIAISTGLCSHKKVYVDLKNSKIKASYEVGPIKIGKWQQIKDPEYVS